MPRVLRRVEERYSAENVFKLDGVSVESTNSWFNVRLSNTEPVVRLTAESLESHEALKALVGEIESLISEFGGARKGMEMV